MKELWYFLNLKNEDSQWISNEIHVQTFKIIAIKHNKTVLKQLDLDQPSELNLTFDYEYYHTTDQIIRGSIEQPVKLVLN